MKVISLILATLTIVSALSINALSNLNQIFSGGSSIGPFQLNHYTDSFLTIDRDLTDYEVNGFSLLKLHRRLVDIPSVSENEKEIAQFLSAYLEKAGFTVELQSVPSTDADKQRYNVYAYIGKSRNTKLLVTSHIDTVPPYFPYRVENTKIYGRGSCDAKASVVTQIFAALSLIDSKSLKEGDLALLYVVGEEKDGSGMRQVSENLNATWEAAIFGEPTELKLGVGHKGNYMFNIFVEGKASHSGYPELGISASEILVPILNDLLRLDLPKSDLLGPSTLNIGRIDAGIAANVIPASAKANVFIRVAADLEKIDKMVREITEGVDHLSIEVIQKLHEVSLDFDVPGFENIILAYATDVPNLTGIQLKKRYLYGPGSIHVAHGANEYVENDDLLKAIDGYKKLIEHALSL